MNTTVFKESSQSGYNVLDSGIIFLVFFSQVIKTIDFYFIQPVSWSIKPALLLNKVSLFLSDG